MKIFEIKGELIIHNDMTHHELLQVFYKCLKEQGIHFKGITKEK